MLLQALPSLTGKPGAGGRAASAEQPPEGKEGAGVLQGQVLQDSISLQEVLMSATLERSFELQLEVRPLPALHRCARPQVPLTEWGNKSVGCHMCCMFCITLHITSNDASTGQD